MNYIKSISNKYGRKIPLYLCGFINSFCTYVWWLTMNTHNTFYAKVIHN